MQDTAWMVEPQFANPVVFTTLCQLLAITEPLYKHTFYCVTHDQECITVNWGSYVLGVINAVTTTIYYRTPRFNITYTFMTNEIACREVAKQVIECMRYEPLDDRIM